MGEGKCAPKTGTCRTKSRSKLLTLRLSFPPRSAICVYTRLLPFVGRAARAAGTAHRGVCLQAGHSKFSSHRGASAAAPAKAPLGGKLLRVRGSFVRNGPAPAR